MTQEHCWQDWDEWEDIWDSRWRELEETDPEETECVSQKILEMSPDETYAAFGPYARRAYSWACQNQ